MEGKLIVALLLTVCAGQQAHAAVNCTTAGRFAKPADATCKTYVLCVLDSATGNYTGYTYTCPTTSVFNPNTHLCTTSYTCPSSNTTDNSTSTPSSCTAEGFFADANSTDCSSYIQCVEVNATYSETVLTCPNGTFFDPNTTLCSPTYNCTTPTPTPAPPTGFTCTAAGRFPNGTDSTCSTYYLCVQAADGTYTAYEYTCPNTSVFNPNTRMCTTSYTCPS